ncbi:hypothetical protein BGZ76_002061, partial [Entomortierella beljakovae]
MEESGNSSTTIKTTGFDITFTYTQDDSDTFITGADNQEKHVNVPKRPQRQHRNQDQNHRSTQIRKSSVSISGQAPNTTFDLQPTYDNSPTNFIRPPEQVQEHASSKLSIQQSNMRARSLSNPNTNSTPPVSILKNKPKSILRSRSRSTSHNVPTSTPMSTPAPTESSEGQELLLTNFPAPPSSSAASRISVCSSSSSVSRNSLYLQQDPMVDGRSIDNFKANPKNKAGTLQRRLSNREAHSNQA